MSKLCYVFFSIVLFALITLSSSWAESAPTPLGGISSRFGPGGTGFPVGYLAPVLNFIAGESEALRLGTDKFNDDVETVSRLWMVKFRYGIAKGLDIRSVTPIYNVTIKDGQTNNKTKLNGIGDTTIALHKVVMSQQEGSPFSFAFDFAGVLPTAQTDDGSIYALGNRAWGIGWGFGLTYFFLNSHRLDHEFLYVKTFEGEDDYQKGAYYQITTAYAYAVNNSVDLGLESVFLSEAEAEVNGRGMNNGMSEWYIGPKVTFKSDKLGGFLGLAVNFPVYRDYDQVSPSDDYRFEFKLVKAFDFF